MEEEGEEWGSSAQVTLLMGMFLKGWEILQTEQSQYFRLGFEKCSLPQHSAGRHKTA